AVATALIFVAAVCVGGPVTASAQLIEPATTSPPVTVEQIQTAMLKAATARARGSATVDGSHGEATLSEVARFRSHSYDLFGRAGAMSIEHRVLGRDVYTRWDGSRWCKAHLAAYPAITVDEVVFSVEPSNAKPVRLGRATIAHHMVTHYR